MTRIVIVNGMPETGKTTVQELCREILKGIGWNCIIESSVDWVKEIARYAGWNGEKTDCNRKFLSDLKRALTDWDDSVLKHLVSVVDSYHYTGDDHVIFIDIREPAEIEKAKLAFNASTLLVRRPQVEDNKYSNTSDMDVFNYDYDYTIWNNDGLMSLRGECGRFLSKLLLDNVHIYKDEESYS